MPQKSFNPVVKKKFFNKARIKIERDSFKRNYYTGLHLIADFWGYKIIEDKKEIKEILISAAKKSKSIPLRVYIHKFSPQGITAVALLSESHITIHSWPEKRYLAIDIFTCGQKADPHKAMAYLRDIFQPEKADVREIKRGKN